MSQTFPKTGSAERITDSAGGITNSVPIALKRRARRALVALPDGKRKRFERAKREPWKEIWVQTGCDRTTAWRRLNGALLIILENIEIKQGKPSTLDAELYEALA